MVRDQTGNTQADPVFHSPRTQSWLPAEEDAQCANAPQASESTAVEDMQADENTSVHEIATWKPNSATNQQSADSVRSPPLAGYQPPTLDSLSPAATQLAHQATTAWDLLPDADIGVSRRAVSNSGWAGDTVHSVSSSPTASASGYFATTTHAHHNKLTSVSSPGTQPHPRQSSDSPNRGALPQARRSASGTRAEGKSKRPLIFSRFGVAGKLTANGYFGSGGGNRKSTEEDVQTVRRRFSLYGGDSDTTLASFSSMARKSFTRGVSSAAFALHTAAVGDDQGLNDMWTALDTEQNEAEGAFSSTAVVPEGGSKPAATFRKRSLLTLLWYYWQGLLFSLIIAGVGYGVVGAMAAVPWHITIQDPDDPDKVRFEVNYQVMAWMLLLQCFVSLNIYSLSLYICVNKSWRIPKPILITLAVTTSLALLICGVWWYTAFPYWYYYLDLILIVVVYVPSMTAVGWCMAGPGASTHLRINDATFVAALELLVAGSTLVYCTFLMPFFMLQRSAWIQMAWLCVLHPLYFEVTTGYIIRKALQRNKDLGRTDVTYFLSIVHAAIHPVALTTSLQASIEPIKILIVTVTLYSINKLIWRSTIMQRDLLVERLFRGWSYQYPPKERAELARMVTVSIITEMILENASILVSPFMMRMMWESPIFMGVVPNTFFDNGGTYPVKVLLLLLSVMLTVTFLFDILFYILNYWVIQQLPLIYTWRRIKAAKGYYLGFLVYGFASMGVMFVFTTMLVLPRAAFCRSPHYCDCKLKTFHAVCKGEFISTLADYLV